MRLEVVADLDEAVTGEEEVEEGVVIGEDAVEEEVDGVGFGSLIFHKVLNEIPLYL